MCDKTALVDKYKLLVGSKDIKGYTSHTGTPSEVGIWTWLWGMITNFVQDRGMQTKVSVAVDVDPMGVRQPGAAPAARQSDAGVAAWAPTAVQWHRAPRGRGI